MKSGVRNTGCLSVPSCARSILVAERANSSFSGVSVDCCVSSPPPPVLVGALVAVPAGALVPSRSISRPQRHVTPFVPQLVAVLEARRARQAAINEMFLLCGAEPFLLTAPVHLGAELLSFVFVSLPRMSNLQSF